MCRGNGVSRFCQAFDDASADGRGDTAVAQYDFGFLQSLVRLIELGGQRSKGCCGGIDIGRSGQLLRGEFGNTIQFQFCVFRPGGSRLYPVLRLVNPRSQVLMFEFDQQLAPFHRVTRPDMELPDTGQ